jgi:hypothetical protein
MSALNRTRLDARRPESPDTTVTCAWLGRTGFAVLFVAVWSGGFLVGGIGTRTVSSERSGYGGSSSSQWCWESSWSPDARSGLGVRSPGFI